MPRIPAFQWRLGWIEGIDILEVRRGSVQALSVNDQMAVVADLHVFAPHRYHAFDIELILFEKFDAPGFKHDDFSALGGPEIVGHAVHKQMIAGFDPQVQDVLALMK